MAIRSCLRGNFLATALFLASVCQAAQPGEEKEIPSAQQKEKSQADRMLSQAFGADCKELRQPIRISLQAKGSVIAAGQFEVENDGRVRLTNFSAALFHGKTASDAHPEIATIRCDAALLTFDRPVSQISELATRTVVKVEMQGKHPIVVLLSNRRTADKSDDLELLVTNGNLFYEQARNLLWTDGVVRLSDYQTKPPMSLRGKGFEIKMSKPRTDKHGEFHANIERLVVRADVEAHFPVDAACGFPGLSRDRAKTKGTAQIRIRADGGLIYDLIKQTASIEIPSPPEEKNNQKHKAISPRDVFLERLYTMDGKDQRDLLVCDRLALQIRRSSEVMEIMTAKASVQTGNDVVLSLEFDGVRTYGNSFTYSQGADGMASKTVLKGRPLRVATDGGGLTCTEFHLSGPGKKGEARSATVLGPGRLDLLDRDNSDVWSKHILWRDRLMVVNVRPGILRFDSLKVYGAASFIDDRNKHEVHGEQIDVNIRTGKEVPKKP